MAGKVAQEIRALSSVDKSGRLIWRAPQLLTWIQAIPGVWFLLDMRPDAILRDME
ncbi:hypothetical protein [Taklimakanibacter deserti]|uniref:hypothetical protein n=1 Tax=Taklimakanibacter deserti TaxID=2267839 RepID=UPI0013C529D0